MNSRTRRDSASPLQKRGSTGLRQQRTLPGQRRDERGVAGSQWSKLSEIEETTEKLGERLGTARQAVPGASAHSCALCPPAAIRYREPRKWLLGPKRPKFDLEEPEQMRHLREGERW